MVADKSCTATFTLDSHTLTLTAAGNGTGSFNIADVTTHDYGTRVTVSATAGTGSHFVAWTGTNLAECEIGEVSMVADKSCTATFALDTHILTLVKTVTNDDGGDKAPDDWTLSAIRSSGEGDATRDISTLGGSGVFETVFANTGYDLSESTGSGYTAGRWSCDGGSLSVSTITLTEGDTEVTCTINNDDIAPTLMLVKTVTNDDGGVAQPDDFNLTVGGTPVLSGETNSFLANTPLAISEDLLAVSGYEFVSITGPGCPTNLGGTITLAPGDVVTCTINNDDIAPINTAVARMTGGGSFFYGADTRVTHGFQLRCDKSLPNRLQVNWGKGESFHLTSLLEANCYEDSGGYVFEGVGMGRCNGGNEVTFDFTFSDYGEPGTLDFAALQILCRDWTDNITSLELGILSHKPLHRGNHQVHNWGITGRTDADETASEEVTSDSSGSSDGSGDGSSTDSGSAGDFGISSGSADGSGSGNDSGTNSDSADSSGTSSGSVDSSGSAGGPSGNSQQSTEAPASQQSWWARYLAEMQAAASDSQQAQATDEVQPQFTAWTWGYEDDSEGELQPPGASVTTTGTGFRGGSGFSAGSESGTDSESSPAASPSNEEAKLTWWQRYLLKKQSK